MMVIYAMTVWFMMMVGLLISGLYPQKHSIFYSAIFIVGMFSNTDRVNISAKALVNTEDE